ncbi:hypothetical protein V1502_11520 [Bacillus sp. SCS-153A]|uniref:hypothetical protein n=1 Tax=Rossellomorea sedimentorum TaxID=3115294 RepID=UPI00390617F1
MWWVPVWIGGILSLALFIDIRRKKNNNHPHMSTDPHAKQGESSNFTMGDNRYTSGGE